MFLNKFNILACHKCFLGPQTGKHLLPQNCFLFCRRLYSLLAYGHLRNEKPLFFCRKQTKPKKPLGRQRVFIGLNGKMPHLIRSFHQVHVTLIKHVLNFYRMSFVLSKVLLIRLNLSACNEHLIHEESLY